MGRSSGGGGRSGGGATAAAAGEVTQSAITQAYDNRASQGDLRMSIADLSDALGTPNQAELHSTLRQMQQSRLISLTPIEFGPAVTPRMRAAAIDNGGGDLRPYITFR